MLLVQEMDSWHNEGLVLPQFQLDCYGALLGMGSISDAADWLQMHAAQGSSVEAMGVSRMRQHVRCWQHGAPSDRYRALVTKHATAAHIS
jgi:hypothetical protein